MFAIRAAAAGDLRELAEFFAEGDRYHSKALPEIFRWPAGPARPQEWLQQILGNPDQQLLVAQGGGAEVLGFVHGRLVSDAASGPFVRGVRLIVEAMVVDPASRRQGIGSALLGAIEVWGRAKGARRSDLHVWEFNGPAIRLYEALGYRTLGRRMGKPLR